MENARLKDCINSAKDFNWTYHGTYTSFEVYLAIRPFQDQSLHLIVAFPPDFPFSVPLIYWLEDGDHLDNLPHLMSDHRLCYMDMEGTMWDESNPAGLLREVMERAFQTITKSMTGASDSDYLTEFDHHWHYIQKARPVESLVGELKDPQLIYVAYWNKHLLIGESWIQIEQYANRVGLVPNQVTIERMLFIPLTTANGIRFKKAWDLADLRRIIFSNIGFKNRVKELLSRHPNLAVYLSLPGAEAGRFHLGAVFTDARRSKHPLLDKEAKGSFYAISINRMDKAYLLPRGGVRSDGSAKKVVVIGCGAIGSIVVQELAKAGIAELLLIDPDIFSHNNLHRHVLGMPYLGWLKVKALKDKLEKDLPHVKIDAIPLPFADVKHGRRVDFTNYDLVVDATAVVPASSMIAHYMLQAHPGLPLLHTWLEPLGIGGHALLSNHTGRGCFKCLYSNRDPKHGIYNRAAFAAKGQLFRKAMFGCAGGFTPFSSLDALKTASLAVELALKVLSGEETGHPLLSWKGDSQYFLDAGYLLSGRYNNCTEQELYEHRYDYVHENCPLCVPIPA